MKSIRLFSLALATLTSLTASPGFAEPAFCWRDSETRSVGTIPSASQERRERIGVLCYSKCGPHMRRGGFAYHSTCPADTRPLKHAVRAVD